MCTIQHLCTFLLSFENILFQLFHTHKKNPTHPLYMKSNVITLMKALSPHLHSWFLPPLSSQRFLFIIYRGNCIALQLAVTAPSISLAKLLRSWIENVSACPVPSPGHLHAQCLALGMAGNWPLTDIYEWTKKIKASKCPNMAQLVFVSWGSASSSWRLTHAVGILLCIFHLP